MISSRVRDSPNHKIILCKKCGHVQLHPVPTSSEDKIFYDENKQAKNIKVNYNIGILRHRSRFDTERRVKIVKSLMPKKGKVLDIGSGYGFFLELMQKNGYQVIGIEVSKERRKISKKISDAKLLNINFNEQVPDIGKFDMIVMFHVLEHLSNPINFLKNILKLLKPRGKILLEVPNVNDYQLELNKSYKKWYWQRAHLNYFAQKTLKVVLRNAGFKKVKIFGNQRYSIENMFNWKLLNQPQTKIPSFQLDFKFDWLEKYYKKYLEKKLKCDTLLVVGFK